MSQYLRSFCAPADKYGRALFCARGRSPRGQKCARNLLERREGERPRAEKRKEHCGADARVLRTRPLSIATEEEQTEVPSLPEAGRGANAPRLLGGAGDLPPAITRGSASIATVFKAGWSLGHR